MHIPKEYDECVTFAAWLDMEGYTYSHIPQETFTKSWGTKMKNQRMGVRRGVPDYLVVIPNKGLVFVEMKRIKGGKVSPEQQHWIDQLNQLSGVEAKVCKGAEEAINYIKSINI